MMNEREMLLVMTICELLEKPVQARSTVELAYENSLRKLNSVDD